MYNLIQNQQFLFQIKKLFNSLSVIESSLKFISDEGTRLFVRSFSLQIIYRPPRLMACGIYILNSRLLAIIVTGVLSYQIILIQNHGIKWITYIYYMQMNEKWRKKKQKKKKLNEKSLSTNQQDVTKITFINILLNIHNLIREHMFHFSTLKCAVCHACLFYHFDIDWTHEWRVKNRIHSCILYL